MKKAIYLSGGGARGAYQAGVLRGISDILGTTELPVDIISSVSAGAINASYLAMHADNFSEGTERLSKLWSNISCDQFFKATNFALLESIFRNGLSMMFHMATQNGQYLLDTHPLAETLKSTLDFERINRNIDRGLVKAFEVAAMCYDIGKTVSFVHAYAPPTGFKKIRHFSNNTRIKLEHIMASAAFPLFFPAIKVGKLHFGDGGLRHSAPLRASIKFGADNILVIGTRKAHPPPTSLEAASIGDISFANVLGNMLNGLFLDNLDTDLRLLNRINQQIDLIPQSERNRLRWKKVNVLYLHPSIDIGKLAAGKRHSMPYLLQYIMKAFGGGEQAGDFTSFLLFEADYCQALISCGYDDAIAQKDQINQFFSM
jgi:NTE family protein